MPYSPNSEAVCDPLLLVWAPGCGLRGSGGLSTLVIVVIAWILLQWFLANLVTPLQNTSVACQTVFVNPFPDGCVRTRFVLLR